MQKQNILVSIKPAYADLILQGVKTIELRRRFPKAVATGTKIFIYSTTPTQKVVGYALISNILNLTLRELWDIAGKPSCVSYDYFQMYFRGLEKGFGIILEQPVTLEKQVSLRVLRENNYIPPQSYRFVPNDFEILFK